VALILKKLVAKAHKRLVFADSKVQAGLASPVSEFIDPVFAKTSPKRSFSITKNDRFGSCYREYWVYKFGHWQPRH
jgi:hypothetical protein